MKRGHLGIIALVAASTATTAALAVLPWPVDRGDQDKHLLSVLEYKKRIDMYGTITYSIHPGIDIFANPSDDPLPSPILTVTPSIPLDVGCDDKSKWGITRGCSPIRFNGCWAALSAQDGSGYVFNYGHLACQGYEQDFMDAYENHSIFGAQQEIGTIQSWGNGCSAPPEKPSHLHLEVLDPASSTLLLRNPLLPPDDPTPLFGPFGNLGPPKISGVYFAADDTAMTTGPWSVFAPPAITGTCLRVEGDVDVIVGYESHHRASGTVRNGDNLGARFVRYRFCGGSTPDCAWQPAYDWSKIPYLWGEPNLIVEAAYSLVDPYQSVDIFSASTLCGDDVFYAIPTNLVQAAGGLLPDRAGAWRTVSATGIARADDQHFTVTVEVVDLSGAKTSRTTPVCVSPPEPELAVPKILARDCDNDDGSEPSPCTVWSESPDITILPVGSSPPAVSIQVCMRNIGNKAIPAASSLTIELSAKRTTGSSAPPFSWPVNPHVSDLKTRAGGGMGSLDWVPGEERCAVIDGPPSSAPSDWNTYDRLSVSVARDGDTPNAYGSSQYDNNRAEKGVDFLPPAPVSGVNRTDIELSVCHYPCPWNRIAIEGKRELSDPSPESRSSYDLQLHVGPGCTFGEVVGGIVVGTMTNADHAAWRPSRPLVPGDPGLQLPGGGDSRGDLGARADVWRVITIPNGVPLTTLEPSAVEPGSTASLYLWPKGEADPKDLPTFLMRVYAKGANVGAPVEVFQRVLRP